MEEMMDLGSNPTEAPEKVSATKNPKTSYPSITIDKDMGMKMGQEVMMKGRVSGIRKDNYGNSTTIEVRKCCKAKSIPEDEYMKMSEEEKDKADEKNVMSKEEDEDKEDDNEE